MILEKEENRSIHRKTLEARILVINMMAQHITFNKAIKTVTTKNFIK